MSSQDYDPERITKVVKSFNRAGWLEFAKLKLRLTENEIEECEMNYHLSGMNEQRYQMVLRWKSKNGRSATMDVLESLAYRRLGAPSREPAPPLPRLHPTVSTPTDDYPSPFRDSRTGPTSGTMNFNLQNPPQPRNANATNNTEHVTSRNRDEITPTGDASSTFSGSQTGNGNQNTPQPRDEGSRNAETTNTTNNCRNATSRSQNEITVQNETAPKKVFSEYSGRSQSKPTAHENVSSQNSQSSESVEEMAENLEAVNLHGREIPTTTAKDGKKSKSNNNFAKKIKEIIRLPSTKKKNKHTNPSPQGDDAKLCDRVHEIKVNNADSVSYSDSKTDKGVYTITDPKGLVLILNNTFRETNNLRRGAEMDVKNMVNLWRKLGCDLYGNETFREPWKTDKTAQQMEDLLREVSEIKKKYSFLVIVIMTHGGIDKEGNAVFHGSDNKGVKVKDVERMFHNSGNPNLHNIPKFFIFQFCRGRKIDKGTVALDNFNKNLKKNFASFGKSSTIDTDGAGLLPSASDILVAYATHEEHAALRDIYDGSWFINAITNVFMHQAAHKHVLDMLTVVNRAMKSKTAVIDRYEVKAMSKHESSLAKDFYLFPGFP